MVEYDVERSLPPAKAIGEDTTVVVQFAVFIEEPFRFECKRLWIDSLIMCHCPYVCRNHGSYNNFGLS